MCKVYLIDMDSVNDEIIWEITTLRASRNVSCKKKKKNIIVVRVSTLRGTKSQWNVGVYLFQ